MHEISCEICMDLMPLVADGVASPDSRRAVEAHMAHCETCRRMYAHEAPPAVDTERIFEKIRRKLNVFWGMLLMFGIIVGLSLTGGNDLFYNILLMPAIGALGYCLFRWKALCWIPALLFGMHVITNYLGFAREYLELPALVLWTSLYCLFAGIGFLIAWLIHFALRKER